MAVIDEIERLSRSRQALWFGSVLDSGYDVDRFTSRLADLYEQKRHEAAQATATRRSEIVRRARVESELERLIGDKRR